MGFVYPSAVRKLIHEFTKLPSIGEKSAQRLVYHLLSKPPGDSVGLADAIKEAVTNTRLCERCFFLSEESLCSICRDERRDQGLLCVVEKPQDVLALEKSGAFRGIYHVLHGVWSPIRGVRPEDTKMNDLMLRIEHDRSNGKALREVIIATGTTVEGDATALYLAQAIQSHNVSVTRIAQGLPKGGELEFVDELTLNMSLENRKSI